MFKIFVIIIIAVGIFFWYPTSGDPIQKEIPAETPQHSVQLPPAEHSKATVFLLSILPPKQTWPDPIQKIWLSLNIEEAVQERTNDIEWVPITDIPIEMQQALLSIEDYPAFTLSLYPLSLRIIRQLICQRKSMTSPFKKMEFYRYMMSAKLCGK